MLCKTKKETECIQPSGYMTAKKGRLMFWCTCAECGIKKNKICKKTGSGIGSTLGEMALEGVTMHAIPWLGKKAVEMGRYEASELMRNKKMQKKAVNFALDKSRPLNENVGSQMLDSLSTKIRPNKKYKTDKKDLNGGAIDIHNWIPKPKGGWAPSDYKYLGPYKPLDKQLKYDPNSEQVLEWYVQPKNKVDEIAAYHDICYDRGIDKGNCDRQMVKSLGNIPYGEMTKWEQTARFLIKTKQKLGLGLPKSENVNQRRVMIGLNN